MIVWCPQLFHQLSAQRSVSPVPISQDPVFSIQATAGYFFWNAREVFDSTQGIVRDHREALNSGFRYGADLLFHLNDGFSLGASYRQLGSANSTPAAHWNVPVTDSNNRVVIDPNTGNLLYGPRYGTVYEEIRLWFIGAKLLKEFELDNNIYLGIAVTPGIVNYYESGNFVGYEIEISGANLVVDLAVDAKYQFDRNWSALFEFSLLNGSISTPEYTDRQQGIVSFSLQEPQSIINWSFNFGIRYTFNRKEEPGDYSTQPERVPSPSRSDSRFQLLE